jgi:carbohydrate kinase (thermoresistant glucokinase family)
MLAAPNLVVIVMGVSGAGKSTIAEALNAQLRWPFQEGDALHPPANVQKMHEGVPLTDQDRAPWLRAVRHWIDARIAAAEPGLITCSALKRSYRRDLVAGRTNVRLLYLKADPVVLQERLAHRSGHFMPASLLQSQLDTLEEPGPDENPIIVPVDGGLDAAVAAALAAVRAAEAAKSG